MLTSLALVALGLVAPPSSRYVVENALAATMGKLHNDKDAKGSLATFMQQSPERLAIGLKHCLPPETFDVDVTGEDNVESGLVLSSKRRVYFGPRALGLWVQPKLLLWVRSRRKGRLLTEASYIAGEAAKGVELTHLSVQTRLTWVESAIDHLQGGAVPCLLMNSRLQLEIATQRPLLAAFLPKKLLQYACQRAVSNHLAVLQGAFAAALVEAYEEWCVCLDEELCCELQQPEPCALA